MKKDAEMEDEDFDTVPKKKLNYSQVPSDIDDETS